MEQRINLMEKGQAALRPLFGIGAYLNKSSIDIGLRELICFRVSQVNGCAYCVDMHSKDARAKGETEQRLYGLSAWRDAPYYTERERAAFEWAEAVTACDIPDDIYTAVKKHFTDEELIDLTMTAATVNTWNRLNIAFPNAVGTYQVGQFA